ncbi:MAG: hypothetical protein ACERKO_08780 [Acetanaerobacterium sp.]
MDNLYEFDHGGESGWIYLIDDQDGPPGVSCGAFSLEDGDFLRWTYVTSIP